MSEDDYSLTAFAVLIIMGHGRSKGFELAGSRIFRVWDFIKYGELLVTRGLAQRELLKSGQYEYTLTAEGLDFLKEHLNDMTSEVYTSIQ